MYVSLLECAIMQATAVAETGAEGLGRRVREARKELGLRQDELAMAAGVSTRAVHQIERGKATSRLDVLSRVLEVLGLALTVTERSGLPHGARQSR